MMLSHILQSFETTDVSGRYRFQDIGMSVSRPENLASCFDVSGLAANSILTAVKCLFELTGACGLEQDTSCQAIVDQRLASLWFGQSLYPDGWSLPPAWDDLAGDYLTRDGWIRLHTNAIHHRKAAVSVLNCDDDRKAVENAVRNRLSAELESAIVNAGGCAAEMRSLEQWKSHPQGQAIAKEPLVIWNEHGSTEILKPANTLERPLKGIRVLDLTRVLAGPVATRFLAAYGADVLRIDPVDLWDDSVNAPEMSLGKRCAGLDLRKSKDRNVLISLMSMADVFVHGYRPGALEKLGFNEQQCREINAGLVTVSLSAYGWSGPWAQRRGFDSLVQMSSGIADAGMIWKNSRIPHPLPVQALDHATGYLMAAAALYGIAERIRSGRVMSARLSLAKTADLLSHYLIGNGSPELNPVDVGDFSSDIENTVWGLAKRLKFPLTITNVTPGWDYPAGHLRSSSPAWRRRKNL
jgi:hypothetical protein